MSKKHHGGPGPVPPGNKPKADTTFTPGEDEEHQSAAPGGEVGAPFDEQDPKRRLGDFTGAGEHPRQQPGPLNDGDKHSK